MFVKIDRLFEIDTDKVKDKKILILIADCIENIQKAKTVSEIEKIKIAGHNLILELKSESIELD